MINFALEDVAFTHENWTAPDGKRVPFERADITDLLGLQIDEEVQITRWPRKVTIHLIVTEGVDGYTGDGDGDGVIFEPVMMSKYTLAVTDRATLERDFDAIMQEAYDKFRELENKDLWV